MSVLGLLERMFESTFNLRRVMSKVDLTLGVKSRLVKKDDPLVVAAIKAVAGSSLLDMAEKGVGRYGAIKFSLNGKEAVIVPLMIDDLTVLLSPPVIFENGEPYGGGGPTLRKAVGTVNSMTSECPKKGGDSFYSLLLGNISYSVCLLDPSDPDWHKLLSAFVSAYMEGDRINTNSIGDLSNYLSKSLPWAKVKEYPNEGKVVLSSDLPCKVDYPREVRFTILLDERDTKSLGKYVYELSMFEVVGILANRNAVVFYSGGDLKTDNLDDLVNRINAYLEATRKACRSWARYVTDFLRTYTPYAQRRGITLEAERTKIGNYKSYKIKVNGRYSIDASYPFMFLVDGSARVSMGKNGVITPDSPVQVRAGNPSSVFEAVREDLLSKKLPALITELSKL